MRLFLVFVILGCFSILSAQNSRTLPGVTRVTTPSGMGHVPKPDKTAQWMKYVITIPQDGTLFSMQIKEYKNGDYVAEPMDEDWIIRGARLDKGRKVLFELVPDLSNPLKLSLFVYTGDAMWLKTRYGCRQGKFKYIQYEKPGKADAQGNLPLLLVYEDSASGEMENEIAKLAVNGCLPAKYAMDSGLFKRLSHCMLVYCQLKTK